MKSYPVLMFFFCCGWVRQALGIFHVLSNGLYYGKQEYNIRGINWFGMETNCRCPHGLWVHSTEYYMDLMRNQGFNSIRIPFSFEYTQSLDSPMDGYCLGADPFVINMTERQYLHHLFYHANLRGMTILLDFHSNRGIITPYPTSFISEEEYFQAWKVMLLEYGNYQNLIGIDIKNEPHGGIQWKEWAGFVKRFLDFVNTQTPIYKGLFFVQGVEQLEDKSAWGGSFSQMSTTLGTDPNPRIVFSPHVYGVSVRGSESLWDGPNQWDLWFGNLNNYYDNLICIGEMGGWDAGEDYTWHQNIIEYLKNKNIRNFYYWCLNPDSQDTGGVLGSDWTTMDQTKIDFCKELQPDPTFIYL